MDIPPNALGTDGYVAASTTTADTAAATRKLEAGTGDPFRFPATAATWNLSAFDASDNPLPLSAPATVSLPFTDDGAGNVQGAPLPVRSRELAVYWLDENRLTWLKLSSNSSPADGAVRALVSRWGVFAPIGRSDEDLSNVQVSPQPYRPKLGHREILFTGVGQYGKVKIYTVTGELVDELTADDVGRAPWKVATRSGRPAATGIYLYEVESGGSKKRGKLAVIR